MNEKKPVSFEPAHKDKWGNQYVLCPACALPMKEEGVLNHVIRTARSGEKTHLMWLKGYAHGWRDACLRVGVSLKKAEDLAPVIPKDIHTLIS